MYCCEIISEHFIFLFFLQRSGRQSGYGFVHFSADHAGIIAAFDALSRMNNNTYDGVTYSVEPSKNLLRQMDEMNLGVPGNRGGPRANQTSAAPPQYQQHQSQQSLYDRSVPVQSRMEPQYRPHHQHQQQQQQQQGRDDFHQMSKLYQQQPQASHMNHQSHHYQQHQHQQGRYGQGMNQAGNAMYTDSAQGYGGSSAPFQPRQQQQQAQFEPHAHRYAPQHALHSAVGLQQQQPYGRLANHHQQLEHLHGGNAMLPTNFGGVSSSSLGSEDLYCRPHSYTQSADPLSLSVLTSKTVQGPAMGAQGQGPSPRAISQTMSSSPSAGKSHVRNSSRDLDFASAVLAPTDDYVSSYVIEKPIIDDRYFDAPSKDPAPLPVPSSYSYGQNGSPSAFGEKHLASSAELQHQAPHGAAAYSADRRGGLSGNSQSLYSHLPAGSVRPPHVPAQAQQQSRRPVNVTDLEIGRSRSMSSAGLPTFSTNATTDCEGGFFKSANSSFTDGAHPRFAHINSFGDYQNNNSHSNMLSQGADTWTGLSDNQQHSPLTQEALQNHQPTVRRHPHALTSSMRQVSIQSVTTNGCEDESELVEDDFTFAAALATTHESSASQDSLFNYMDSKASSFALPSPPYGSSYASQGFSLKDGCAAAGYPPQNIHGNSGAQQQRQHSGSEMDELALEAKNLSLAHVNSGGGSGSSTARSSLSDEKKPSPKSRQLAVTHFFKPVSAV